MQEYVLVLPFNEAGALFLIESGRFPGKYNGAGGVLDTTIETPEEAVDRYLLKEIGWDTSEQKKTLVAYYDGPEFHVLVYSVVITKDMAPPIITEYEGTRGATTINPRYAGLYRDDLAPNLVPLIAMALENPTIPFEFWAS